MAEVDHGDIDDVGTTPNDFFDHEPSRQDKIEVRKRKEKIIDATTTELGALIIDHHFHLG